MKFKNVRRPPRAAKAGILVEPQAKRFKPADVDDDDDDNSHDTRGRDEFDELSKLRPAEGSGYLKTIRSFSFFSLFC